MCYLRNNNYVGIILTFNYFCYSSGSCRHDNYEVPKNLLAVMYVLILLYLIQLV